MNGLFLDHLGHAQLVLEAVRCESPERDLAVGFVRIRRARAKAM